MYIKGMGKNLFFTTFPPPNPIYMFFTTFLSSYVLSFLKYTGNFIFPLQINSTKTQRQHKSQYISGCHIYIYKRWALSGQKNPGI